ncbi:hypothetical protein E2C01_056395 [Portunus trituberculatus]|uniref:Uncharacterized protein n=1 Tax=Portunus trituberculatus TaxID=210409 RepID=A0A5B7GQ81_PORTR|nr:hypothetical protein [Portunus trituberculatus]
MYDDVAYQDWRRCHLTQGVISPGGSGKSQVTTQVQIDSLLIWKDTLTLPRLCCAAKTKKFVYRINK